MERRLWIYREREREQEDGDKERREYKCGREGGSKSSVKQEY